MPYTPKQNGVVEKNNQTLMENIKCIFHAKVVVLIFG
jgi:hypothetical protein